METSMTSEMILQQIIWGETERPNKDREFPEIAKRSQGYLTMIEKLMGIKIKRITEIEQTRKNLIRAKEVYFDYLQSQKMAHSKHTTRERVMREGRRPPRKGLETGKVP